MANLTTNCSKKRERKKVIPKDRVNRYELDGTNGLWGDVYCEKSLDTLEASNTVTITVV